MFGTRSSFVSIKKNNIKRILLSKGLNPFDGILYVNENHPFYVFRRTAGLSPLNQAAQELKIESLTDTIEHPELV